jgi:hypothetical protein
MAMAQGASRLPFDKLRAHSDGFRAHGEAQGAGGFRCRSAGYLPSGGLPEDGEKWRARGPGV